MSALPPPVYGFVEFARLHPEKPALVCEPGGVAITYGALDAQANRIAHALRGMGVGTADCVAICLPNGIPLVASVLAAQRIGIYFTLISPKASLSDLRYIVADSGSHVLMTSVVSAMTGLGDGGACQVVAFSEDPAQPGTWEQTLARQPDTLPADPRPGMEMIYSSGTTGRPKGIRRDFHCKTWGEVDSRNVQTLRWLSASSESVYLSTSPLYHSAPYRFLSAFLDAGATVVALVNFDAQACLDCIDRYSVTHSSWVPTMFQRLLRLDASRRAAFSGRSMTHVVHGAAPCPPHVKRALIDWWGPVVYEYYSGTEGIGRTYIDSAEWLAHPGSVGRPSGCVVHILDEQGQELPSGQNGHIFFESGVTFDYWNDPAKTLATISRQGWRTFGDIGHVDQDGYLYLTDRSNFMVISGGVNIYPQEIENTLLQHPAVLDAAVFGAPDDDLGEQLVAVVQPADAAQAHEAMAQALRAHCRSLGGSIKTPKLVRFCLDFPRMDTGKVQKRLLRERLLQEPQPWLPSGTLRQP